MRKVLNMGWGLEAGIGLGVGIEMGLEMGIRGWAGMRMEDGRM